MNKKKNDKVTDWREMLLSEHFQEIFNRSCGVQFASERLVELSRTWNKSRENGSGVRNMTTAELQEFEAVLYVMRSTFSRIEEALNSAESVTFDEILNA